MFSGTLIFYSINKINDYRQFLIEDKENFEREKEDKIEKNKEEIIVIEKAIGVLETEIETFETEITTLQRQKTDEFMNSRGFSDRYYALEDQITAKRKDITKKEEEIGKKRKDITEINSTIWAIENGVEEYKYAKPKIKGISPYVSLWLGIFGTIVTLLAAGISQLFKSVLSEKSYREYNEIDEGVLSEIDVKDGKLLKKELFGKLESLLLASSKADYDTVRKLCTKNMAKSYTDELDLLKKHKQKLVIKDIDNVSSKIINVRKGQHNIAVTLVQKITLYDYTLDSNNKLVDGNNKKKQTKAFKLVFIKNNIKNNSVNKCPNCGANVQHDSSVKCEYCGTVFDNSNYDWCLESKVIINED